MSAAAQRARLRGVALGLSAALVALAAIVVARSGPGATPAPPSSAARLGAQDAGVTTAAASPSSEAVVTDAGAWVGSYAVDAEVVDGAILELPDRVFTSALLSERFEIFQEEVAVRCHLGELVRDAARAARVIMPFGLSVDASGRILGGRGRGQVRWIGRDGVEHGLDAPRELAGCYLRQLRENVSFPPAASPADVRVELVVLEPRR